MTSIQRYLRRLPLCIDLIGFWVTPSRSVQILAQSIQVRADTPKEADYEKHLNRIDDGHMKSFCAATESAMQPPNWNLACQASVRYRPQAASMRQWWLT